jgi:hypothetical protein
VFTTGGATDQLKSGSRCQSRSNRLKYFGLIVVDELELSQKRIGAVPLRFLGSHVRYQLSGRSLRRQLTFSVRA